MRTDPVQRWKPFLQRWAITTVGVLVAAHVVRGIHYDSFAGLLVASLLLGALNAFLKPYLLLLSLPFLLATLGLFVLFINGVLLYVVGLLVVSFHVATFGAAFWGGVVISLVSLAANLLLGRPAIAGVRREPPRGPRPPADTGSGPVIDV